MPGIAGIVGKSAASAAEDTLADMLQTMKHHPWYQETRYIDDHGQLALGRMTLGFVNTAAQPAFNEDRSLLAMMEGEVYDYEERRRELVAAGHVFRTDSHAELLLHGFEHRGKEFFSNLSGTFVAAIWDTRKRQLILVNDRFGMKPLYYAKLPGRLLFASEIKAILADPEVSRKTDRRGIAQFFTFGQLLGEDTLFEAVRHVPAASWLTYDLERERLTVETYWRLEPKCASNSSESDLLDAIASAFKRAVDRRAAGTTNLGLSLSGGLDSRSILAVLERGTSITTVSMGIEGSLDHRCAKQMADLFGCPHRSYYLNTQFLADFEQHLRWLVHVTDGHYQSQCVTVPTLPLYRDLGIEVLFRGHAGELLHMNKAYSYSMGRNALGMDNDAALEDWLFCRLPAFVSTGGDGPLFAKNYAGMTDLARESLRRCLRESSHIQPTPHRVWHLFLTQRLRRETALSMVEFGSVVETRLPFLDNDLVDVLFAAPPGLKMGDRIQAHLMRRHMPSFLGVTNANTGAPLGAGKTRTRLAELKLRILAKLGVKGYQPYERLGRWLREELRPLVNRLLLSDRCLERGIFEPQTVRAVVEGHWSGRRNHTFLLMAMMIFELGQREFCDGSNDCNDMHREPESCAAIPSSR